MNTLKLRQMAKCQKWKVKKWFAVRWSWRLWIKSQQLHSSQQIFPTIWNQCDINYITKRGFAGSNHIGTMLQRRVLYDGWMENIPSLYIFYSGSADEAQTAVNNCYYLLLQSQWISIWLHSLNFHQNSYSWRCIELRRCSSHNLLRGHKPK